MMFGVMEQAPFDEDTVLLSSGDRVIVYTDGITERSNPAGEEFGPDRLASLVASSRPSSPPAQVTDRILRALDGSRRASSPTTTRR